jgi:hypothetical protein
LIPRKRLLLLVTDINGKYIIGRTIEEHYANVRKASAAGGAAHGTDVQ